MYLGLSFGYHDSAVALVDQYFKPKFALAEERLSRVKNDNRFPRLALAEAIKWANTNEQSITGIGYYEDPVLKSSRKLEEIFKDSIDQNNLNVNEFYSQLKDCLTYEILLEEFDISSKINTELKISNYKSSEIKVDIFNHHLSHAANSFISSPFNQSGALTLDASGEYESASIFSCDRKNNRIEKIWSQELPFSLGLFYSAICNFLGFKVNEGEYKMMGLSAYGEPIYTQQLQEIINFTSVDGVLKGYMDRRYIDYAPSRDRLFTNELENLLDMESAKDTTWVKDITEANGASTNETIFYCNLAASAQAVAASIIVELAQHTREITGLDNLCFSGGCALNSLANRKVDKIMNGNLFIPPAPGDAGSSLGAAFLACRKDGNHLDQSSINSQFNLFLALSILKINIIAQLSTTL